MPTVTYTSNGTFSRATATPVTMSLWGAGGDGSANGTGGSGGSYVVKSVVLQSGSYNVFVGQRNADGLGNGGDSYFQSASVIIARAAGGRSDGTITHQASFNTGSTKYVGGAGGTFSGGYGNYGAGSGGSAAGGLGVGIAGSNGLDNGASFPQYGHSVGAVSGASGEASGGGNGGNSAYYDAGTNSRLIPATNGEAPGGGGGGGYSGETNIAVVTEGRGALGRVDISY